MSHRDIRIGTMAGWAPNAVKLIKQLLPHGFESFQLNAWRSVGDVNWAQFADEALAVCGDKAIISTIGLFGNPLIDADCAKQWEAIIDNAHHFGTNVVVGFAGAVDGKPLEQSIPVFKKVWTPLAARAKDKGVKIAWENCDMGGRWEDVRWNIAHAPRAWEMMFNELAGYDNIGLEWEPCHQLNSLVDPIPQLRKIVESGRLFHIHGKDATVAWDIIRTYGIRGGKPFVWHRTPGFGDTNWTDVISILRMFKWNGSIDIEGWHDPVYCGELEYTGQVHALNYLKNCRGGPFVPNPVVG